MKTLHKYIAILLISCVTVTANDEDNKPFNREQFIGIWAQVFKNDQVSLKGFITYEKDGTIDSVAVLDKGKEHTIIKISGTWELVDNTLVTVVKESSHPKFVPIGKEYKDQIIELTETTYRYTTLEGKESQQRKCVIQN